MDVLVTHLIGGMLYNGICRNVLEHQLKTDQSVTTNFNSENTDKLNEKQLFSYSFNINLGPFNLTGQIKNLYTGHIWPSGHILPSSHPDIWQTFFYLGPRH